MVRHYGWGVGWLSLTNEDLQLLVSSFNELPNWSWAPTTRSGPKILELSPQDIPQWWGSSKDWGTLQSETSLNKWHSPLFSPCWTYPGQSQRDKVNFWFSICFFVVCVGVLSQAPCIHFIAFTIGLGRSQVSSCINRR